MGCRIQSNRCQPQSDAPACSGTDETLPRTIKTEPKSWCDVSDLIQICATSDWRSEVSHYLKASEKNTGTATEKSPVK